MKTLLRTLSILFVPAGLNAAVLSYDFNTPADFQGWTTTTNVSGYTADGNSLVGVASNTDPQILLATPNIASPGVGESWTTVEFRVRETDSATGLYIGSAGAPSFSTIGAIVQVNGIIRNGNTAGHLVVTPSTDNFFIISTDISALGSAAIDGTFRVDPIGGALGNSGSDTTNNTFEVDYIRITNTAVPEPSAALLGGLAGLLLLRRRRD